MRTGILPKSAAWSGVCIGFISWAAVAEAGVVDDRPVSVPASGATMTGTTYGTTLVDGAHIQCEVLADWGFGSAAIGYCQGEDAGGDEFFCNTSDPVLILAIQTIPDFARITVTGGGGECTSIRSQRGSRYLPPGERTGLRETAVSDSSAWGTFYGTRVSADKKQSLICTVTDTPTYSYTTCQATDLEGDNFYCSSDEPGMVAAARALKSYSDLQLSRIGSECIYIWSANGSNFFP